MDIALSCTGLSSSRHMVKQRDLDLKLKLEALSHSLQP